MTEPPANEPLDDDMYEIAEFVVAYATPEEAAAAQCTPSPGASARVVGVRPTSDPRTVHVIVQLDVAGNEDSETVICVRAGDGRWWSCGSFGGG